MKKKKLTMSELEARAKSYGSDLCCICRECDECETNPCRLKIDAMNGYKDGLKKILEEKNDKKSCRRNF